MKTGTSVFTATSVIDQFSSGYMDCGSRCTVFCSHERHPAGAVQHSCPSIAHAPAFMFIITTTPGILVYQCRQTRMSNCKYVHLECFYLDRQPTVAKFKARCKLCHVFVEKGEGIKPSDTPNVDGWRTIATAKDALEELAQSALLLEGMSFEQTKAKVARASQHSQSDTTTHSQHSQESVVISTASSAPDMIVPSDDVANPQIDSQISSDATLAAELHIMFPSGDEDERDAEDGGDYADTFVKGPGKGPPGKGPGKGCA
ncbi:hypothetical protein B484DRAFT_391089 [Ochromonadaceae sp. CCMP2298]|nr:hypothetical protein B484DRAFT_391089 [Ochromonadaceae sp. CCMP2298]